MCGIIGCAGAGEETLATLKAKLSGPLAEAPGGSAANTVSVSTAPPNSVPNCSPMMVTMGISALGSTWARITFPRLSPFARAVATYCSLIWSRKLFFVSSVSVAKAEMVEARTGNVMCQK